MISSYSVQSTVTRIIRGPHVKRRTPEIKLHVDTIKFYRNLLEMTQFD